MKIYSKYSPKLRSKRDDLDKEIKTTTSLLIVGIITIICLLAAAVGFKSTELGVIALFLIGCWLLGLIKLIANLFERNTL